jgi:hypothetical protein
VNDAPGLDQHPLHDPSPGETPGPRALLVPGRLGTTLEWRQVLAVGLFALAVVVAALGWYGVSGKADPAEQLPYLASGAVGAAVLVALGVTSLLSFEHARDRMVLERVLQDIGELRERSDRIEAALAVAPANGSSPAGRTARAPRARAKAGPS